MNLRSVGRCGPSYNSSIGFRDRVSSLRDCQTDVEQVRRCYIFNFREPRRVKKNQEVTIEFMASFRTSRHSPVLHLPWLLYGVTSGGWWEVLGGQGGALVGKAVPDCMLPGSYSSTSFIKSNLFRGIYMQRKGAVLQMLLEYI